MQQEEARRTQRRQSWKIELASSFADAEEQSRAYWRAASPAERLNALEQLREQIYGPDIASRRLQRFLEVVPSARG